MEPSKSEAIEKADAPKRMRAIAYYRDSFERPQRDSIPTQQDQVRELANKNAVEIIREFSDVGKPGNACEDRPAFTEMIDEWVKKRTDFSYILCLDVSRLGRLQDDRSVQFEAHCKEHHKLVIYTSNGARFRPEIEQHAG